MQGPVQQVPGQATLGVGAVPQQVPQSAGMGGQIQTQLPSGAQGVGGQASAPMQQPGSVQPQPYGPQIAGTTEVGQFQSGGQQLVGQPSGLYPEQFADHLNEELRVCLDDCIDVSQVASWAADRCLDEGPTQAECSRLCTEAAALGGVAAQFISRDSMHTPAVIEAYLETAEDTLSELEQFDHPHTNEAAAVVGRSIDSSLDALESL